MGDERSSSGRAAVTWTCIPAAPADGVRRGGLRSRAVPDGAPPQAGGRSVIDPRGPLRQAGALPRRRRSVSVVVAGAGFLSAPRRQRNATYIARRSATTPSSTMLRVFVDSAEVRGAVPRRDGQQARAGNRRGEDLSRSASETGTYGDLARNAAPNRAWIWAAHQEETELSIIGRGGGDAETAAKEVGVEGRAGRIHEVSA